MLQEEVKLTEHLGHVPPVDLVDDKNERFPGRFLSPPGDPLEPDHREAGSQPRRFELSGAVSLDEVLVGIGGVELHQTNSVLVTRKMGGEFPGHIRLPGSRRTVEDDLAAMTQKPNDTLQMVHTDEKERRPAHGVSEDPAPRRPRSRNPLRALG